MAICLIGNGVYRVDGCTAHILSDGSIGQQKFNFPSTDFRVYVLKKESGCGFIGSGTAILYFKDKYFRDWVETGRVNTPSSEGYVEVWFDIKNPGDKYWKIVWGDCVKEFVSGSPEPIFPDKVGDWYVEPGYSGGGDITLVDNGVKITSISVWASHVGKYLSNLGVKKDVLVTEPIFKFNYLFESVGATGNDTSFLIQIYIPYVKTIAQEVLHVDSSGITFGAKEYDLSGYVGQTVKIFLNVSGYSSTPYTASATITDIGMCTPNWQCEQPLNGYEYDVSGCLAVAGRRLNSACNPCIPIWRCNIPFDGTEIDGCGNSRLNPNCTAENIGNRIINGSFDNNLDGWTAIRDCLRYGGGNLGDVCARWPGWTDSEILWDNGRARLRVLRCADAYLEQTFKITGSPISFDTEVRTDGNGENQGYDLLVDGTVIKSEGLGTGTKLIDVSQYIGQSATLRFWIKYGSYCYMNDHGNTYLWVDNVKVPCPRVWRCEQPPNGYEFNDCNERRPNPACSPCIPEWKCEEGQTGYEADGCGNRRENIECAYREAVLISCRWPEKIVAGTIFFLPIIVNQGSKTEDYKIVFSGDLAGESDAFTVNAGKEQQEISIPVVFGTGGSKSAVAALVRV